jgi:hypothetical protein
MKLTFATLLSVLTFTLAALPIQEQAVGEKLPISPRGGPDQRRRSRFGKT